MNSTPIRDVPVVEDKALYEFLKYQNYIITVLLKRIEELEKANG